MRNHLLLMKTVTPLHVGTGRSSGYIDLEIARERSTRWPVVPGSSVKGVLRSELCDRLGGDEKHADLYAAFGVASEDSKAGTLCCGDLRIVLFPAPSLYGGFAFVTSPAALRRFADLLEIAGKDAGGVRKLSETKVGANEALVAAGSTLAGNVGTDRKVILEDLDLTAREADLSAIGAALGNDLFGGPVPLGQVCVVGETEFAFLCEVATEVSTKVTLEYASKTAKKGGLRTEEAVPCEAVFAGVVHAQPVGDVSAEQAGKYLGQALESKHIQFGGKGTTGQGLCRVVAA